MSYQKIQGTRLFNGRKFEEPGAVLIINEDGIVEAIVPEAEAGEDIQRVEGIVSPGWVNAHCHLELSYLKGMIPPNSGMVDFLLGVMKSPGAEKELMEEAMRQADETMRRNGIVAVGDISNTSLSAETKARSPIYYHSFVETAGFIPSASQFRVDQAIKTLEIFQKMGLPCSLSPHAPYSVSQELLQKLNTETAGQPVSIHNQESSSEDLFLRYKKGGFLKLYEGLGLNIDFFEAPGTGSIEWWLPAFTQQQKLLLVHNVCTSREDFDRIKSITETAGSSAPSIHFCLCPNANLYIQQLLPDPELFIQNQAHVCLGTDSLASNHDLNIWEEIKTLKAAFPSIPLETFLQWGTLNGAETLGVSEVCGSFEKGKRGGRVILNFEF